MPGEDQKNIKGKRIFIDKYGNRNIKTKQNNVISPKQSGVNSADLHERQAGLL